MRAPRWTYALWAFVIAGALYLPHTAGAEEEYAIPGERIAVAPAYASVEEVAQAY
jgi:hypothetical protein